MSPDKLYSEDRFIELQFEDLFTAQSIQADDNENGNISYIISKGVFESDFKKLVEIYKSGELNESFTAKDVNALRNFLLKDHYSNIISLLYKLGYNKTVSTHEFEVFSKLINSDFPIKWFVNMIDGLEFNSENYDNTENKVFRQRIAYLVAKQHPSYTAEMIKLAFRDLGHYESKSLIKRLKIIFSSMAINGSILGNPNEFYFRVLNELRNELGLFSNFVWANKSDGSIAGLGFWCSHYPNLYRFIKYVSNKDERLAVNLVFALWKSNPTNDFFRIKDCIKIVDRNLLIEYLGNDILLIYELLNKYLNSDTNQEAAEEIMDIIDRSKLSARQVYQLYDDYIGKLKSDRQSSYKIDQITQYFKISDKFVEGQRIVEQNLESIKSINGSRSGNLKSLSADILPQTQNQDSALSMATKSKEKPKREIEEFILKLKYLKSLLIAPNQHEPEITGLIFSNFASGVAIEERVNIASFLSDPIVLNNISAFLNLPDIDGNLILTDGEIALILNSLMKSKGAFKTNGDWNLVTSLTVLGGEIGLSPLRENGLIQILYAQSKEPYISDERRLNILSSTHLGKPIFNIASILNKIFKINDIDDIDYSEFLPTLLLKTVFNQEQERFVYPLTQRQSIVNRLAQDLQSNKTKYVNYYTVLLYKDAENNQVLSTEQIQDYVIELGLEDSAHILNMLATVVKNSPSQNNEISLLENQTPEFKLQDYLDILKQIPSDKLKSIYKMTHFIPTSNFETSIVSKYTRKDILKLYKLENPDFDSDKDLEILDLLGVS